VNTTRATLGGTARNQTINDLPIMAAKTWNNPRTGVAYVAADMAINSQLCSAHASQATFSA
jgi:hypothetical protein